jgi:Peptidase family C25/FlgD Ig-like domain
MAEEMFWLRNKGGIGVIAASRPVFATSNREFVKRLYQSLFNNKSNTQTSKILGTALLQALGGGDNDQKFGLLGDPTMKLADAGNLVSITSVTPDTLKALSTVEVTARVTDVAGNPLTSFRGDALIRVFDTKDTVLLSNYSNLEYQYPYYTKQEKVIFKGLVSIDSLNNGEFTAKFIVPKSIKYDDTPTGRISIYAWSGDMGTASGFKNDLILFGTESLTDNHGPEIDFSFEGQEDFFDGDYVTSQPTVIIGLFDSSGINLTQEVGHRIELSIDGNIRKDVTQYFVYDKNSYRSGQLRYTLPALSPGNHALTISAWDNVNNLTEQEVNFRTIQINELALEEVVNYPNPFAEDTHFTFQFQSPTNFGDVTIKIYTVTGRLIQQLETVAQPGFNRLYWDGRDRDGDKLANGVYLYKIIVNDGQRKIEKIEKLAVLR